MQDGQCRRVSGRANLGRKEASYDAISMQFVFVSHLRWFPADQLAYCLLFPLHNTRHRKQGIYRPRFLQYAPGWHCHELISASLSVLAGRRFQTGSQTRLLYSLTWSTLPATTLPHYPMPAPEVYTVTPF